jgi:hypothetical protein
MRSMTTGSVPPACGSIICRVDLIEKHFRDMRINATIVSVVNPREKGKTWLCEP